MLLVNQKMVIIKLFALFTLLVSCHIAHSQNFPELTVERVKKDIRHSSEEEIPENLDKLADRPIKIFYLKDHALAHINNKMGASQGYLQQSYVLTYQIIKGKWERKSTIPYNIQLLSKEFGIFLSENSYCSMMGDCTSYIEFSKFSNDEMIELISYSGYDKYLYILGLFSREEDAKALSFKGDTITNNIKVKDYIINEKGLASFKLEREIRIFDGWDEEEELLTRDSQTTTTIELK